MSISKRKDRHGKYRYLVRVETPDPVTGERKRTTIGTFATKKEAEREQAKAITERERGTLLAPDSTTVAELLDEYMTNVEGQVAEPNRLAYRSVIERHIKPALGQVRVRKLTTEHIDRLLSDLLEAGYSPSLRAKVRMRLIAALDLGIRWNLLATNVARHTKAPKITTRKERVWTRDEVTRFLHCARDDARWPYWLLLVETGARTSELLGIEWSDVDLDRGTLRLARQVVRLVKGTPTIKVGGKTLSAPRTIRLTPGTVRELRRYRTSWASRKLAEGWSGDLLFCTGDGAPLSANNLRKVYDRLVRVAGVTPITPHEVRKTAITLAIDNGASPKAVAARVGHRDARVTLDVYSSVTSDMDDALLDVVTAYVPQRRDETGA